MSELRVYNTEAIYILPDKFVEEKSSCSHVLFVPQCAASHHILH